MTLCRFFPSGPFWHEFPGANFVIMKAGLQQFASDHHWYCDCYCVNNLEMVL